MIYDLVITDGLIINGETEFQGDIAISGEKIIAIGADLTGKTSIDATGKFVLPGAIDSHVHMKTERKDFCYDDDFRTGSVAAAFGGVTTIIDQVQAEQGLTLDAELSTRMALAAGNSCEDYAFHMNIREPLEER